MNDDATFVREAIVDCSRCELRAQAKAPVPFSGPVPAANGIAIVAEAPGKDENEAGEPLIGRAGTLLQDEIARAGIDWASCTKLNTASCFPGEIKTPQRIHIEACEMNKLAQLDLAAPKWVLLCGRVALEGFRTDLPLASARGRPFCLDFDAGPVFFTTYHPSAGLRKFSYLKSIRDDLTRFAEMVGSGDWIEFIGIRCVICGEPQQFTDSTGIPWCEAHLPPEGQEHQARLEAEALTVIREHIPGVVDLDDPEPPPEEKKNVARPSEKKPVPDAAGDNGHQQSALL